jgi:hypothetical protein
MIRRLRSPWFSSDAFIARSLAPGLCDGLVTDAEARAMFVAALECLRDWEVTDNEAAILFDLTLPTLRRWRSGKVGRINRDRRTRVRNILIIHETLSRVFREPQWLATWIRSPAAGLGDRSALTVMLDGELSDLIGVRRYVETLA